MTDHRQDVRTRLRKVEGQVRGLQRMIDEQRPCDEVLAQILAARTALERVAAQIVTHEVDECLNTRSPEEARESIARAVRLLSRAG